MEIDTQKLHNMKCVGETLRRDSRPDDISENKEDVTLIWLDENINDLDTCKQTINLFRQLNDYVLLYTNPQLCIDYIKSVVNENIFLIISNTLAATIADVHTLDTIDSIFIYAMNDIRCNIDLNQYPKIIAIFTDQHLLMESIKIHAHRISKQTTTGFFVFDNSEQYSMHDLNNQSASFLFFHLLIDVLKQLPQTAQAKKQMIDMCRSYYQTDDYVLNDIENFGETYQPSDAIRWYTGNSFVHKLLNKALRTEDVSLLHLFRFYIIDLCKQIEQESEIYLSSSCQSNFLKLYRGQKMSKQDIDRLKKHVGNLISPNGFFSASKDLNVALMFAGNNESTSVLFDIKIDRTAIKTTSMIVAAAIERFSYFPDEQEVLFNIGTAFKLENIIYDDVLKKWRIHMVATDQGLEYIQTHIELMRKDLEESTPTTLFGELLINMGQYSKAESYYKLVLDTLPKDHDDLALLYHGLGYVYYKKREYNLALKYGEIAHEILKTTVPLNQLKIAQSLINLGWDHKRNGNLTRAIEFFKEALKLREENYVEKNHINIAIALVSIGDTNTDLGDYESAFYYLTKGLKMFKRILPREHTEICNTLMKIGNLFEKQSLFNRAIQYYRHGYKMAKKVMPIDHPRLLEYLENIMGVYKKMNQINDAIRFSNENLALQCEFLGEMHPNIAQILMITGDFITDIEEKLSRYYQALHILEKCVPNDENTINACRSKIDATRC